VRDLYEEAAAVAVVSPRAGAAFARVTVERLIKHLDPRAPVRATLEQRIARIKEQGISTPLGQMLDMVRVTGNDAVHVNDQPNDLMMLVLDDKQSPELVRLLLQAANDLVDERITRPRFTEELWGRSPKRYGIGSTAAQINLRIVSDDSRRPCRARRFPNVFRGRFQIDPCRLPRNPDRLGRKCPFLILR
jgi:Domain of unknown function (DUF4145)